MDTDKSLDKLKQELSERGEEANDIIEKMPMKFGIAISFIILILAVLMIIFGWIIRYPDTVSGSINITAERAPVSIPKNQTV
ncbi:hypothetical protein LL912_07100 [Niabella sp. CC-SYL272]|uniref:hypothetical protein n=1 Tax=Niabella agricola TaxID=2891571 RepID=UPI001F441DBA|nr:hypothetical protein [Niabella agricola]MCF3108540.1 hypothetical protein [Niabella agricola]